MQIFIKLLDGKTKVLEVEPFDLVELLMDRVKDVTGMPLHYQRLIHQGKQLHPDNRLSDYGVKAEDTIHLVARLLGGIRVNVKTLSGKVYGITIHQLDTVKVLKRRIQEVEGTFWEDQQILFEGELLDNDMALELYGIDDNMTVHMIQKINKCSCCSEAAGSGAGGCSDLSGNSS
jgi:ubiquitin C